jgi:mono/diheme cytochrome c family protein
MFMNALRARNLFLGCVVSLSQCGPSGAEELDPMELQNRVRSIFLAKCSECHGRGLSRPRAALYLHELGQLAANREWVVPHEPEKSYLWTLIRDDDMPAKGAKAGPLNAEEKQ